MFNFRHDQKFSVILGKGNLILLKRMGPIPRNTSIDLDSVIAESIERILTAFDDAVQVGLIKLRVNSLAEMRQST